MEERIFNDLMRVRVPRLAPPMPGSRVYSIKTWMPDPETDLRLPQDVLAELRRSGEVPGWQFICGRRSDDHPGAVPVYTVHEIRQSILLSETVIRIDMWGRAAVVDKKDIPDSLRSRSK